MNENNYNVIGVMSGTSLDGVDLAHLNFSFDECWKFKILKAETIPYSVDWINQLKKLTSVSTEKLKELDISYTRYLSQTVNTFIQNNKINSLDAICSHGHTALHQPLNRMTYQIGNLPEIAYLTQQIVVCDFRTQDVALGGQGAPLVPIGDRFLFSEFDFCLNLGGFANISMDKDGNRIAYDICPVNIVLNHFVSDLGFDYDDKGKIASQGELNHDLLTELNSLRFYQDSYPKSLGLEWVKSEIFPLINTYNLNIKDILRTFTEHIAIQISKHLNAKKNAIVLVSGGGAYNDFLIKRIQSQTNTSIIIPDKTIIEFKEALIFGFLGVLRLRNEVNCLRSVTGASKDHSSGKIYSP